PVADSNQDALASDPRAIDLDASGDIQPEPIPGLVHAPTAFDNGGSELPTARADELDASETIEPTAEGSHDELLPEPEDLDALEDVELDLSLDLSSVDDADEAQTDPMLDEPDPVALDEEPFEQPGTELHPGGDPEAGS
ncbi:MAG: hypothetical protein VCE43_20920, partial [Myxococcota bacterium]